MKHTDDIGSTGDARRVLGLPDNYEYNFAANTYWNACCKLASARAIMQKFVDKVDRGMARSIETYAEMKQWMEDE